MKIQAYMTTYNRFEMMYAAASHLVSNNVNLHILNDGSEYPDFRLPCTYVLRPHGGREKFWKMYDDILRHAERTPADIYLFAQDDFQNIDVERIKQLHNKHKNEPYIYHLINDGRKRCWTHKKDIKSKDHYLTYWVDCTFFCNRAALDLLGYYMKPVHKSWFDSEAKSSGVGKQLTKRIALTDIRIYKPLKSLAYHGDHTSVMYPAEREKNKLISI